MDWWNYYWNGLLQIPLDWCSGFLPLDTPFKLFLGKLVLTVLALWVLYTIIRIEIWGRIRDSIDRKKHWHDVPMSKEDAAAADEPQESPEDFKRTVARLRKDRQYAKLAQAYSARGKHKDAAYWYKKAGMWKQGAHALAQAGKTLRAATWLEKAGEYEAAAQFYAQKGWHRWSAKAYERAGDLPAAASEYAQAKKFKVAAETFLRYFQTMSGDASVPAAAADRCYALINDERVIGAVSEEQRRQLMGAVALCFETAERAEIAAGLHRKAGNPTRAAQIYARLGQFDKAVQCMTEAGKPQDAAELAGRAYESKSQWAEAGVAYVQAGQFRRAGDCFSKANDPVRAAAAYEKAGEFYGAGFAMMHAGKWEGAIPLFQKVREDHPNFNESRAFLGRCFYELKDYAHCAAALENHLLGKRVETNNIDYFWMLALALEQLGELVKSRELLLKIHSVSIGFRDVSQRLSNINTRISMTASAASGIAAMAASAESRPSQKETQVMEMVANCVGTRYALERELGRGGMGVIYLARDTALDRPVALKFLGALVDGNEEFKRRFEREAKAAAKVNHPNIVSIYDIGTQEGKAYIAMEYIEGGDLSKYLRHKGRLSPREAANIMIQVCSALDAVHKTGIVHRDLKPENIVITRGALVKVMDFGLALVPENRLTAKNVVMGTPLYMSPEQVRGEEIDARSDIYSLGIVLYELLTGVPPFEGGDLLKKQLEETPPPPSQAVPDLPKEFDDIVMKCIAKDKEARFGAAQELIDALRAASHEQVAP